MIELTPVMAVEKEQNLTQSGVTPPRSSLHAMVAAHAMGASCPEMENRVQLHGDAGKFVRISSLDRATITADLGRAIMAYRQTLAEASATIAVMRGFDNSMRAGEIVPCFAASVTVADSFGRADCREDFCPMCVSNDIVRPTLKDLIEVTLNPAGDPSGDYQLAMISCSLWFNSERTFAECAAAMSQAATISAKNWAGAAAIKQIRFIAPPYPAQSEDRKTWYTGRTGKLLELILLPAGAKFERLSDLQQKQVLKLQTRLQLIDQQRPELLKHQPQSALGVDRAVYQLHSGVISGDKAPWCELTSTQLAWNLTKFIRVPDAWYGERSESAFLLNSAIAEFNLERIRRKANKERFRRVGTDSIHKLAQSLRPGGEQIKLKPVRDSTKSSLSSGKLKTKLANKQGLVAFQSLINTMSRQALQSVSRRLVRYLSNLKDD